MNRLKFIIPIFLLLTVAGVTIYALQFAEKNEPESYKEIEIPNEFTFLKRVVKKQIFRGGKFDIYQLDTKLIPKVLKNPAQDVGLKWYDLPIGFNGIIVERNSLNRVLGIKHILGGQLFAEQCWDCHGTMVYIRLFSNEGEMAQLTWNKGSRVADLRIHQVSGDPE